MLAAMRAPDGTSAPDREDASQPRGVGAGALERTALFAASIGLLLWGLHHTRRFFHDDAYISLRYVQRLLAGDGLTWSDGERVEGFTNALWVLQTAGLGWLGVSNLELCVWLLALLSLAGILVVWWKSRASPALLPLLVTFPPLVTWTQAGLETANFCFWLVLTAWIAVRARTDPRLRRPVGQILSGLALAATALSRPEGVAVAGLALVVIAWGRRLSAWLPLGLLTVAVVGGYQVFRVAYYDAWLPNTAVAKLDAFDRWAQIRAGLDYLVDTAALWLPAVLVATLVAAAARSGKGLLLGFGFAAPALASTVLAGGESATGARLLAPVGVACLFGVSLFARERRVARPAARWAVAAIVLAGLGAQVFALARMRPDRHPAARIGEQVGRLLAQSLPAGSLVATATAGSTPFFAPALSFIDTLGLNDRHIARRKPGRPVTVWQRRPGHRKGDGAYVLARRPDAIILGPTGGVLGEHPRRWFLTDFELLTSPPFFEEYQPYRFRVPRLSTATSWPFQPRRPLKALPEEVILYLRSDSPRTARLAEQGVRIPLPPAAGGLRREAPGPSTTPPDAG